MHLWSPRFEGRGGGKERQGGLDVCPWNGDRKGGVLKWLEKPTCRISAAVGLLAGSRVSRRRTQSFPASDIDGQGAVFRSTSPCMGLAVSP